MSDIVIEKVPRDSEHAASLVEQVDIFLDALRTNAPKLLRLRRGPLIRSLDASS
jgi:hypothetical protein